MKKDLFDGEKLLDFIIPFILIESFVLFQIAIIGIILNCLGLFWMTEKRYSLVYYADKGGAFIKNNETGTEWYHDSRSSLLEIVNELNGLADENEQLKSDNKIYVKRYGELFDESYGLVSSLSPDPIEKKP